MQKPFIKLNLVCKEMVGSVVLCQSEQEIKISLQIISPINIHAIRTLSM